jgi:hypothetical protein
MLVFLQGYVLYGVRGEITSLVLVFAMFFGTKNTRVERRSKSVFAYYVHCKVHLVR